MNQVQAEKVLDELKRSREGGLLSDETFDLLAAMIIRNAELEAQIAELEGPTTSREGSQ